MVLRLASLITALLTAASLFANQKDGVIHKRRILALYNSAVDQRAFNNHIHDNAAVILNHLGCIVDYWDIQQGLPDDVTMQPYRGIITWFYDIRMPNPRDYLKWGREQVVSGRSFIIIGSVGAYEDSETGEVVAVEKVNEFTRAVGFEVFPQDWTTNFTQIEVAFQDKAMTEFERTLKHEIDNYERYRVTATESNIYLKLRRKDSNHPPSDMVFTTSQGGFVAAFYAIHQDESNFQRRWRIDPFRFFTEAFGLEGTPRPDVTTRDGLRIWMSHIDGDAIVSKSEVVPDAYCGEVVRDRIIRRFRWPISVSVVVGEVVNGPELVPVARDLYRIPWVEPASHTFSHPFYWADDYPGKEKYEQRHLAIPGYTLNMRKEIIGSIEFINSKLTPQNKPAEMLFWSGNCEPTVEALRLCRKGDVSNINGGDTRFDRSYPSYTGVAPLGVNIDGYWQNYSPNANENIYTNEWEGPYYGFKHVLETFRNTGAPIRIKPINIYYHFYIGEKWASLNTLVDVIEETISRPVAPIFISEYIEIVDGFNSADIIELDDDGWQIKDYGACTTVRFDNEQRNVNMARSQNVLGFNHHQSALYVHLADATDASIKLTAAPQRQIYLKRASHHPETFVASKRGIELTTRGWGNGYFEIANLTPQSRWHLHNAGKQIQSLTADRDGDLHWRCDMQDTANFRLIPAGKAVR